MYDGAISDLNKFLNKVNQFEKITAHGLQDIWKVSGPSFQHIDVKLDLQEYIPGLFDLLQPSPKCPISKIMSIFCFLQIETYNLKHEIESKYFDPLILFGESGLVFEDTSESKVGDLEL